MIKYVRSALAASLVLATSLAPAEDIDLFMGLQSENTEPPNVLIVIDNTANWNTAFTAEMGALAEVVGALDPDKVRLGFMMYTETGTGNGSPDGAYVRAAVRTMDAANKPKYQALVTSLDKIADKSNNGKLGLTMSEVDRYFAGTAAYAGANKKKRDYAGNNVAGLAASNAIYALAGNALSNSADTTYKSPVIAGGCQKNFVIFLSNGKSNANNADNTTAKNQLAAVGGNTTTLALTPSGYQGDMADEWARYLGNKATNPVITYVIDVVPEGCGVYPDDPDPCGQYSGDYYALLNSMADQGLGKYFNAGSAGAADVGAKIKEAFEQIFNEIAAVNSAFSAASLPVSVNTQGVYLNQVFVGMFRPDQMAQPLWNGNLKQYQIAVAADGTLNLADRNNNLAINPLTGFITPCAVSFWTPGAVDAYWAFKQGQFDNPCPTVAGAAASNTPDGDAVEKGAAGYRLRGTDGVATWLAPGARVVKTCTGACNALENFDTANASITAAALGVAAADRDGLINWVRGQDLQDEDIDGNTAEMRPSVHGDVIHSRPLAVDYGAPTGVVVYYGANDGTLRAVEGGQALTDGDEIWSFVAPEHFGKLKRLYDNSPVITFPSSDADGVITKTKDYFMDGSVGGYRTATGAVWIYPTMRRGGRMVYAFDVTNPAAPSLMWRRGCPGSSDVTSPPCDAGFEDIGQTWSSVQVFLTLNYFDTAVPPAPKPIAIFGGGYDPCEDSEPNTCDVAPAPKGDHIYVVDAQTGTLLKTFDTIRSVAADITMVDGNADGKAELAYAVDTGGNIYRIDIGNLAPAAWTMTQVAALGCDAPPCAASGTYNRKFLYAPEVVVTSQYNAVLVGSGDREHPLTPPADKDVNDAFFMVEDKPSNATWLTDEAANCGGVNAICTASLLAIAPEGDNPTSAQLAAHKGWYLAFGTDAGGIVHDDEQVVTSALVVGGVVYFSTYTPTASTAELCGPNLGTARAYAVNFVTAASPDGTTTRFGELAGGGLAPSPVGGLVDIGGKLYPFVIGGRQLGGGGGGGASSGLEAQNAGLVVSGVRSRTHWYIEPTQ